MIEFDTKIKKKDGACGCLILKKEKRGLFFRSFVGVSCLFVFKPFWLSLVKEQ